jgi:FkbM family methyltransferase
MKLNQDFYARDIQKYNEISFKPDYLVDPIDLNENGFISNKAYALMCRDNEIYCDEVNIINKIKSNDENYFNFSKKMIDIGSALGVYSMLLPYKYSYMFEPNNEFRVMSEMNMLLHHKVNDYTIYQTLLSDKSEVVKYDGFETNYSYDTNDNFLYFDINAKTLDSFSINNDIDFIKIDVEGMEYKVLIGGIGTIIRNNYPNILFELWPVDYFGMTVEKHDQLEMFFNDLGYKILWEWGDFDTHLAIHSSHINF